MPTKKRNLGWHMLPYYSFYCCCVPNNSLMAKGIIMKKNKTQKDTEMVSLIKAIAHGLLIPILITLTCFFYSHGGNLLKCEAAGFLWLFVPMSVYNIGWRPEPKMFPVMFLVYIFGMYITWEILPGGIG